MLLKNNPEECQRECGQRAEVAAVLRHSHIKRTG